MDDVEVEGADVSHHKSSIFYTDIDTYRSQFSETWISLDITDWSQAKFLRLNDKSAVQNPGKWEGICGAKCTRHTLSLKADVAQTVFVTAHTWDDTGIPNKCLEADNGLNHAMLVSKFEDAFVWNQGSYPLKPIRLAAGEVMTIELEWNFNSDAHANDWSVIAHGDGRKGTLHLKHDQDLKSDSFGFIKQRNEYAL